jgi:hypothetical protein
MSVGIARMFDVGRNLVELVTSHVPPSLDAIRSLDTLRRALPEPEAVWSAGNNLAVLLVLLGDREGAWEYLTTANSTLEAAPPGGAHEQVRQLRGLLDHLYLGPAP